TGGRLMVIGLQGGVTGELNLAMLLGKRASVHATSLRARPATEKAAIVGAVLAGVWPAIAAGDVRPIIDAVLPLEQVADAHRILDESNHIGKVLLTT
ncbi:MAG: zinc-binding dehydrogenase, partial [Mycobacteriales bacterium]